MIRKSPWQERSVLVTGGAGFLGSHLVSRMREAGYGRIATPRSREYDLTQEAAVERLYRDVLPSMVIHLAARVGGIGANRANPGTFFFDNLVMGALLMEHARRFNVEKFVAVGTMEPQGLEIPGKDLPGVLTALDLLIACERDAQHSLGQR